MSHASRTITCPTCACRLVLPSESAGPYTCPRCLGLLRSDSPERPAAVTPPAAADNCPGCGKAVQPQWRVCPYCETALVGTVLPAAGRVRRVDVSRPDAEAKSDMTVTTVCLVVFGVMLVVGVVIFFGSGAGQLVAASPSGATLLLLGGGLILLLVVGTISLIVTGKSPGTKALAAGLGTLSVALGGGLLMVLLIVAAVCAGLSNMANTCGCGNPKGPHPQQQR